jgi:lipoprotein-anchoring transpeptidase ErfK/SrfK
MLARRLSGVALGLALLAGCSSAPRPQLSSAPPPPASDPTTTLAPAAPTTTIPATPVYTVATAKGSSVAIYDSPVQTEPTRSLPSPQADGSTLVFLAQEERSDWVKVLLPVRPNGATGWVKTSDVSLATHDYHIQVEVGAHKLTVYKGTDVFLEDTVAVGAAATPTTLGTFYTTGLFDTGSTQPVYGPYAYPLSGYSEVLFSFGGGEGQMGIHGTNDPSSLGRNVSNGCIRMSNAAITKLAKTLPVGVPVDIKA